jgi:hypothetical protein
MRSHRRWMSGVVCTCVVLAGASTAHAQVTGPINVRSLPPASCPTSAIPNDGLLDTAAFLCALTLVPASGGEIYVPAGIYNLDASLTVTNKPISFRGEGQRNTTLLWNDIGGNNGIAFTSNSGTVNHQLSVKSMSLLRRAGAGGSAISGVWASPVNHTSRGGTSATIFDVHISNENYGPEGGTPIYWANGIALTNALGAHIHVFNIHGWNNAASRSILIAGKSIGVSINDGDMGRAIYGIHVTNTSENVRVENVETSENSIGYFFDTTGRFHNISNVHAGVIAQGIKFQNTSDATITDNFILGLGSGNPAIEIYNPSVAGDGFEIRGNLVTGFSHGIKLDGFINNSRVTGNMTAVSGNAIWLLNGVAWTGVMANDRSGAPIVDTTGCGCNPQANNP